MVASPAAALAAGLAVLAALAVAVAAILVVRLHALPTGVDPVRDGVSAYALTRWGALYRAQVRASGLAAALIAGGCVLLGLGDAIGPPAILIYAVTRVAIARYPTDPSGTRALSPTGRTHALLAAAAFLSIGVAAPAIGLGGASSVLGEPAHRIVTGLSVAVPLTVLATLAAGGWPGLRPIFGLVERAIYATSFGWLFTVAVALVVRAQA